MARDNSGQRDLEEELRVAQATAEQLQAENASLQTVAAVLIGEMSDEQLRRARRRLEQIETGEEAPDDGPSG
jgi:hypothetical protein